MSWWNWSNPHPMHISKYIFPFIIGFSALLVEACAAFFSIYGLSKLFSGATTAVIVMALSLEIGKVVTASFLYRHWKTTKIFMKLYLIPALLILMLITSIGIYGFLSNAFQTATVGYETQGTQLIIYEQQRTQYIQDRERIIAELKDLREQSKTDIASIQRSERDSSGVIYNRERAKAEKRYKSTITDDERQLHITDSLLTTVSTKLNDLKLNLVSSGTDVGPIVYVARALKMEIASVVQWLILIFILVFDPLAIVLILATNKAFLDLEGTHHDEPPRPRGRFFKKWKNPKKVEYVMGADPVIETPVQVIQELPIEPIEHKKKADDEPMRHPMPKIVG